MEVHRELGCGFTEPVYQDALACEMTLRQIPFEKETRLQVRYKSMILASYFRPDFICFRTIIVEIKALSALSGTEEAQILNYLKATNLELGLLVNFGTSSLVHKRFVAHVDWRRHSSAKSV